MRDETATAEPGPDHAWPDPSRQHVGLAEPFDGMIDALRGFLNKVAGARPDPATLAALTGDLQSWCAKLDACAVDEARQLFARLLDRPGRGQTTAPAFVVEEEGPDGFRGHVTFGRYFLGVNGAAHGGVVSLLFDEVLGRAAACRSRRIRTAYLKTNYRALTPLDTRLEVRGWLDRQEGRKLFVRGEIRHGDVVCADAEGLFLELHAHQG